MVIMFPVATMGHVGWPPQPGLLSQLMEQPEPQSPIDPRNRYWILGDQPIIRLPLAAVDRETPDDPPRSPKDAWAQRPPKSPKEYPGTEPPRSPKNPRGGTR